MPVGRILRDELPERGDDLAGVLLRDQPKADLGGGAGRDHRLGARAGEAAGDAMHFKRRPGPDALKHGIAALARQFRRTDLGPQELVCIEWQALPACFLGGRRGLNVVVDAGETDHALGVFDLGQQLDEAEDGVRGGAAVQARVQVARRPAGLHFQVNQPAQPDAQGWHPLGIERGVGNQRRVGPQLLRVLGHIPRDRGAPNLLFALHQELEVDGERSVDGAQRLDRLDMHVHLSLVVGRAARVQVAVPHGGFEGRADPGFQRIGRLDVVVPVAQDGGFARRTQPVGVDQGVLFGGDRFDVLQAGLSEARGHELGRALDVAAVFRGRAHAGNAQESRQFFQEALFVALDKSGDRVRHGVSWAGTTIIEARAVRGPLHRQRQGPAHRRLRRRTPGRTLYGVRSRSPWRESERGLVQPGGSLRSRW